MEATVGGKQQTNGVVAILGRSECLCVVRPLRDMGRRGDERGGTPGYDIDEYGPITQATNDRFGFVRQGEAAFERAMEDELAAQRGEKTRPFGAVSTGKRVERSFDHVDLLDVELAH